MIDIKVHVRRRRRQGTLKVGQFHVRRGALDERLCSFFPWYEFQPAGSTAVPVMEWFKLDF